MDGAQGTHKGHPYRGGGRGLLVISAVLSAGSAVQFVFRRSDGVGGRVWGVL